MTRPVLERSGARRAALALAAGASGTDAAAEGRVTPRTVRRWKRDPEFQREVARLRAEALDAARGVLAGRAVELIQRVIDIALLPSSASADTRARTALGALRLAKEWSTEEIESRLDAIEQRLGV